MQILAAFEADRTGRIILEYLLHAGTEMVVQRRTLPYAHMASAALEELIGLSLHDHTHALHEEDTAENRH